jgi:Uma2 family endonuclease
MGEKYISDAPEMWIADPDRKTIEVFVNAHGRFRPEACSELSSWGQA